MKSKKKPKTTAGKTKPMIGTKIVGKKEAAIKHHENYFLQNGGERI